MTVKENPPPQFSGSHTRLHELLHALQWAGCPNVAVSCHSCASLLHCAVQRQTISSELQFEHTGVDRAARAALSSLSDRGRTSGMMSNGLISVLRRIPLTQAPALVVD